MISPSNGALGSGRDLGRRVVIKARGKEDKVQACKGWRQNHHSVGLSHASRSRWLLGACYYSSHTISTIDGRLLFDVKLIAYRCRV